MRDEPMALPDHRVMARNVLIRSIRVAHSRRSVSGKVASLIAESMRELAAHRSETNGLINPIVVRETGGMLHLISGLHRLEASKALGHDEIKAVVLLGIDADAAEIEEIDENLCRSDLTMAEADLALARRAEIIRSRAENGDGGPNGPASRQAERRAGRATGPDPASVRDLARKTGRSEGSIKRSQKRVEILGSQTLGRIIRTSLDAPSEAAALAAIPEPERQELIAKAEAEAAKPEPERETISAVAIIREKAARASPRRERSLPEATEKQKQSLEDAKARYDEAQEKRLNRYIPPAKTFGRTLALVTAFEAWSRLNDQERAEFIAYIRRHGYLRETEQYYAEAD